MKIQLACKINAISLEQKQMAKIMNLKKET